MTTTIVIDLAKTVFELAAADERGRSSEVDCVVHGAI